MGGVTLKIPGLMQIAVGGWPSRINQLVAQRGNTGIRFATNQYMGHFRLMSVVLIASLLARRLQNLLPRAVSLSAFGNELRSATPKHGQVPERSKLIVMIQNSKALH